MKKIKNANVCPFNPDFYLPLVVATNNTSLIIDVSQTMMSRLLRHLSKEQQLPIWVALLRGLWSIARRDVQDGLLPELLPAFSAFVTQASPEQMLALVTTLASNDATRTPAAKPPLPVALSNKASATGAATIKPLEGFVSRDCYYFFGNLLPVLLPYFQIFSSLLPVI